ncbi:hypothetical protein FHX74_002584 [Friedmanniella endophytica]|uniref:CAAX prenyl protease 2/Lysostaphin resistance protein A-like domain-containing protein n=1 Tax=Microlunatus kandeliicorticis TaxID=1759536 RepID=A0A7W3P6E3_9ACTN|nr:type II CAAX endopeptidase family protein [Microlunatus kandeliicorticis]MBA8794956.1 hypothetical protein [Microlunatus kandeliicorticis]
MRPGPGSGASGNPANARRIGVAVATLVVGAVLLGFGLNSPPGGLRFYVLTVALALTWAVGAFASGTLHLGVIRRRDVLRRPVLAPALLGLLVGGVFVLGGLVVRQVPPLRAYVSTVLDHATVSGALPVVIGITLGNGLAEELFFRGALFAALGRHRPAVFSTLIYALITVATGNPMLVFAALVLGSLLALQRTVTRGVLAPILTHLSWSLVMLFVLPAVLR